MEYFSYISTDGGVIGARDLESRDVDSILDYWYGLDDDKLDSMGISAAQLPERAQRKSFFESMIGNSMLKDDSFILAVTYDDDIIAYYLLNHIRCGNDCQQHGHIVTKNYRKRFFATTIFNDMIRLVFELSDVKKIISEPAKHNRPMNILLQKHGLFPKRSYLKAPQGICREMVVNRYEIQLCDVQPSKVGLPNKLLTRTDSTVSRQASVTV